MEDLKIDLRKGDNRVIMKQLLKEGVKVDLTVTSPPYDNMRTYKGTLEWGEEVWKDIIQNLYKLTKDGGVVVWIVNDSTKKGSESGTSFKQALYAMEVGFNLHDTMIWKKTNPFNFGSNNCYIQSFEYMFIFSKGKPKSINFIKDRKNKTYGNKGKQQRRTRNGDFMEYEDKEWEVKEYGKRYNIWEYPSSTKYKNHTAVFPKELVKDMVLSWSNKGDTVFDPFMGSGTTGTISKELNRSFVGCEKVDEFFKDSVERILEIKVDGLRDRYTEYYEKVL